MTKKSIISAASEFGALGGRSGVGASKKRSKAHYKRIQALALAARLAKANKKAEVELY